MELNSLQLIDDYLDGELDEAGGERLCAWLDSDPQNVQRFVRHVFLHRQLREAMLAENVGECLEASGDSSVDTGEACRRDSSIRSVQRIWSYYPIVLALLFGVLASSVVTWQIAARWFDATGNRVTVVPPGKLEVPRHGAGPYVATLVNVTNCRWDQALSTADLKQGSVVRSGESLHLLEGVADINSTLKNGGLASLQLEGPLAMTLNSQGMPSLLYGHLTGKFTCDYDQFTLDTPLGRVNVSGDASIGVIAAANKVELHVFSGTATLDLWAMGFGGNSKQMIANAGTALGARVEADGRISVDHGESKESGFITPAALAASRLRITPEYVATIRGAKPVAYWRFEDDTGGVMRNEMSDRFHCRMVGDAVRWHAGEGNSTAEFGMTAGPGYLISDDVLDGVIGDDYTLEAWVKPTYFHNGALISLLQWSPSESPLDRQRVHLELVGPSPGVPNSILRSAEVHPGRIRFIHQTSACYSESPYRVRAWQHIAAVRKHATMLLYVDGKVAATAEDPASLGTGLRVMMGQLFPRNPYMKDEVSARLFVGELDEVALYDRR